MATRRRTITADDMRQPAGTSAGPDLSTLSPAELATWQMPVGQAGALALTDTADDDDAEETATDRVQRLLGELAADDKAVVKLYRLEAGSRKQTWCEDYRPADFEQGGHAMIRRQWGPGTYMIRLYGQVNKGKAGKPGFGVLTATEVTIAPRLDDTAAPAAASGELGQVLRVLAENQAAFQQQVLQQLQDRPAPADPMAQMTQMLSMMTMMRQAMGLDAQQPRSGISEVLQAVRELRGAAAELVPEKAGDDDSASGLFGQVVSAIQTVAPLVQQRQAAQAQLPQLPAITLPAEGVTLPAFPAPAPAPAAAPATPAPADETATPDDMRFALILQLKAALGPLLQLAATGATVDAGVDYLCDQLPDDAVEFLEHPEAIAMVCQFAPEATPHAAWLSAVREAYLALPADDEPEADAAPGVVAPPSA